MKRICCNHCTGLLDVENMAELALPVVKGTAHHKSQSDLYLGKGDAIEF